LSQTNTSNLLTHGRSTSLADLGLLGLGLGDTLGEDLSILVSSILGSLSVAALEGEAVTLVLKTLRSNETLDLWCLGVWLLALTLWLNLTTDNELADIVILGETEELSDLCSTLGTKALWVDDIGQAWDVGVALLDNAESKDGQVHGDNAATDGFTLALTGAAWAVAGVTLREQETDTGWMHDSLLHWETLLVVTTGDSEDVALELVADGVTWDLGAHALVHEDTELAVIVDLNELLGAIGWVGDVQLHGYGVLTASMSRR